jgi:hypothetical protein
MVVNIYIWAEFFEVSVFRVNVVDFVSFLDFIVSAILIVFHFRFLFTGTVTLSGGGSVLLMFTDTFVLIF